MMQMPAPKKTPALWTESARDWQLLFATMTSCVQPTFVTRKTGVCLSIHQMVPGAMMVIIVPTTIIARRGSALV
jgi:hypothetical protein